MRSNYVIWAYARFDGACVLHELEGVDRKFELVRGTPRAATFPADACYSMDAEYPGNVLMPDNLNNTRRIIVASRKLRDLLESRALAKVEYLPVGIRNHNGKILKEPYFIVHPIEPVDCLDVDQCGAVWGQTAKNTIKEIQKLVIDESRIDPTREMFRPGLFNEVILVRRELADAVDAAGITAVRWIEPADYPER